MENYSYGSYTESGDSSPPRSREIEFDSVPAPPCPENHRAKFMCSYGGKILPHPHDNSLRYVGGETKILAVDRSTKLSAMIAKLSGLFGGDDVSFKYQLPGEDLDALISVTNDDDLDLMMSEFDRLSRSAAAGASRPARMRIFLFPGYGLRPPGFAADRDGFVEALNFAPILPDSAAKTPPNADDFLFGLEKNVAPSAPPAPISVHAPPEVSRGVIYPGDHYCAAGINKIPVTIPASAAVADTRGTGFGEHIFWPPLSTGVSPSFPISKSRDAEYWPERTIASGGFPLGVTTAAGNHRPVYVIPTSTAALQRQLAPPAIMPHGTAAEVNERPVYSVIPSRPTVLSPAIQEPPPLPVYSAASAPPFVLPPQVEKTAAMEAVPYGPVGYNGGRTTPRHVYYATPRGVVLVPPMTAPPPPPLPQTFAPPVATVRGGGGVMGLEGKMVISKVPQRSGV